MAKFTKGDVVRLLPGYAVPRIVGSPRGLHQLFPTAIEDHPVEDYWYDPTPTMVVQYSDMEGMPGAIGCQWPAGKRLFLAPFQEFMLEKLTEQKYEVDHL